MDPDLLVRGTDPRIKIRTHRSPTLLGSKITVAKAGKILVNGFLSKLSLKIIYNIS
jgi:hypothetical protein